jgi:N1221-like protein
MDPPLPVYFFNVVSGLRDKSAKGYPVKKVFKLFSTRFLFLSPVSYFSSSGRRYCLVAVAFVISKESRRFLVNGRV